MTSARHRSRAQPDLAIAPLGDRAVVVTLGSGISEALHRRVRAVCDTLAKGDVAGVLESVPAYASVTVHYDPLAVAGAPGEGSPLERISRRLREVLTDARPADESASRIVEIPVCYGGELGPDLDEIAARHSLTPDRVVALHTGGDYLVYMVGFVPGFGYLGGLADEIATPRRPAPRTHVPAGTVGIGGNQTGVYPMVSPGGWNLIGRTPTVMFDPARERPSLLAMGDRVRFRAIDRVEFDRLADGTVAGISRAAARSEP